MEKFIIEVDNEKFSVEYDINNDWYQGDVYSISSWKNLDTGEEGWSYNSHSEGGKMYDNLNEDCRNMFGFNFVWRGVWEGRIYFKDDEYWCEELKTIYQAWEKIESIFKQKIKESRPDYKFYD